MASSSPFKKGNTQPPQYKYYEKVQKLELDHQVIRKRKKEETKLNIL